MTSTKRAARFIVATILSSVTFAAPSRAEAGLGSCDGPPDGRVSCWKGEGITSDSVGANHGILAGDATFAAGVDGQAFRFDGTDDGVLLSNPATLQLQSFTIAAWIRRASPSTASTEGNDAVLFSYGLNGYAFGLLGDGRLFLSKVQVDNVDSGSLRITDTRFHHVTVVQKAGSTVFYVDGVASASVVYDPGFAFTTDAAIGLRPDISSNSFFGDIDEVQIWNRSLSVTDVEEIVGALMPAGCNLPQVTWSDNGHVYQAICTPAGVTWDEANAAAQAAGGYLATINTADENSFVFNLVDDPIFWYANVFNANIGPWLGGFQPPDSPEPGGGWSWVTDEPFLFTAWSGGEPNNSGGTEHRVHYYRTGAPARGALWNDVTDIVPILGYVIEWEPRPECDTNPVMWEGNGHTYQAICARDGLTWEEASTAAQAAGGHLATITSAEENAFVFDLVDSPGFWYQNEFNASIGPWLGGLQPEGAPEPAGDFTWITGEDFAFTAWSNNEPNNLGGTENRVHYYRLPWPGRGSEWNDLTDSVLVLGYLVEWDEATPTATPTPTPTPPFDPTPTATPSPNATPPDCGGDCDGGGSVTVEEIVLMVNIALGTLSLEECGIADIDDSGDVTVEEIIRAVNNALSTC